MKRVIEKIGGQLTWKNAVWFALVNVQSWVIQGALYGALALGGVGTLAAVVSAKVAAWVVFIGQCAKAGRG